MPKARTIPHCETRWDPARFDRTDKRPPMLTSSCQAQHTCGLDTAKDQRSKNLEITRGLAPPDIIPPPGLRYILSLALACIIISSPSVNRCPCWHLCICMDLGVAIGTALALSQAALLSSNVPWHSGDCNAYSPRTASPHTLNLLFLPVWLQRWDKRPAHGRFFWSRTTSAHSRLRLGVPSLLCSALALVHIPRLQDSCTRVSSTHVLDVLGSH